MQCIIKLASKISTKNVDLNKWYQSNWIAIQKKSKIGSVPHAAHKDKFPTNQRSKCKIVKQHKYQGKRFKSLHNLERYINPQIQNSEGKKQELNTFYYVKQKKQTNRKLFITKKIIKKKKETISAKYPDMKILTAIFFGD